MPLSTTVAGRNTAVKSSIYRSFLFHLIEIKIYKIGLVNNVTFITAIIFLFLASLLLSLNQKSFQIGSLDKSLQIIIRASCQHWTF